LQAQLLASTEVSQAAHFASDTADLRAERLKVEVGRVFTTTFAMVRDQFGTLIGLWGMFLLFQILLIGLVIGAIGGTAALGGNFEGLDLASTLGFGVGIILLIFVAYFVYLYLYCVQSIAMVQAASPRMRSSFGAALSGGFRSGLSLFGVFLLFFVGYIIFSFVVGIVQLIFSFLGYFGPVLLGLVSFTAFVYLACRFAVIVPVIAVDGERNPIKAIQRAWGLTEGNVLAIFMVVLIIGVLAAMLGGAFVLLAGGFVFATTAGGASTVGVIIAMILLFGMLGGLFAVLGAALISVLHAEVSSSEVEELGKTFE